MTIKDGVASMTQEEYKDLKQRNMIVIDGTGEFLLLHGYANKILIKKE